MPFIQTVIYWDVFRDIKSRTCYDGERGKEGKEDVNVSDVRGHLLCDPSWILFFIFLCFHVAPVTLHFISCQKVVRMNLDHLEDVLFFSWAGRFCCLIEDGQGPFPIQVKVLCKNWVQIRPQWTCCSDGLSSWNCKPQGFTRTHVESLVCQTATFYISVEREACKKAKLDLVGWLFSLRWSLKGGGDKVVGLNNNSLFFTQVVAASLRLKKKTTSKTCFLKTLQKPVQHLRLYL